MPWQGGPSKAPGSEMRCCSHHPSTANSRARSYQLTDRVEALELESHTLRHPTCFVEKSHFLSQRIMGLPHYCKEPEKLLYPADHLTPNPSPQAPCQGFLPPLLCRRISQPFQACFECITASPGFHFFDIMSYSLHSSHLTSLLLFMHTVHTPTTGPLHLFFLLPGILFCHLITSLENTNVHQLVNGKTICGVSIQWKIIQQ